MFTKQSFVLNVRCCAGFGEAFVLQGGSNFLWKRSTLHLALVLFAFFMENLVIIIYRYCRDLNDNYDNVYFLTLKMRIKWLPKIYVAK